MSSVRGTGLVVPLRHRDDLQGLRAVAVLVVVLAHAGVPFLAGGYVGVDVFFVLSGFLITSLLLGMAAKEGGISLREFYRRRARRILPAAALTLVVTDLVAFQLLNFVRAKQAVMDSLWAAGFAANIHFGRENADYFARSRPPSPIQQFWTLSVEEQFYLVWPLLLSLALFGLLLWKRRRPGLTEPGLQRALLVIVVAAALSLMWSIQSTAAVPRAAYFSTFARIWELALGAALAIAAPRLRNISSLVRVPVGWIGVGAIALAAVLYSPATPFPGYAALLPTLGAALFIGAGIAGRTRFGAGRLLSLAPFRFVGDRSYAFYLWHWPALVIASDYSGALSTGVNLLILAGAFALSCVTYALYENPIRHMRGPRAVGLVLWPASAALVLACALPILASIGQTAARVDAASAAVHPPMLRSRSTHVRAQSAPLPAVVAAVKGARANKKIPWPVTPSVDKVENDRFTFPNGCLPTPSQASSTICRFGDVRSSKSILLFGDSHAMMWMPSLVRMAKRDHWVVLLVVKSTCVPKRWVGNGYATCNSWFQWAMRQAGSLHPQVSLVAAKWSNTRPRAVIPGIKAAVGHLGRASARVIVVGDPPEEKQTPVDCLLAPHATMKTCTVRARALDLSTDHEVATTATRKGAGFMDVRGWFCARYQTKAVYCPMVINRTITRSDTNHVSKTYGLELAPTFRVMFRKALFS